MRAIVTILAILVIVAIIAVATGFVNIHGNGGSMPQVAVQGGSLPQVQANVGSIDLGTKNETVSVPKVSVDNKETQVAVPTLHVNKPAQ
ncbi:hypothetical protein FHS31_001103 [Sphingomonas vulcanisoli]|uniref:Uncharacterized protein n=1 Tax=Sphingomonas vulcanisoli TaxID=1658060 RepID=A0ABX0TPP3_9SPHN|nr:hypothetical protein [Sphingomonas vulcanisoli]NIJ07507.1 hypothetical protein [Sphingomonas vulcanisoli]